MGLGVLSGPQRLLVFVNKRSINTSMPRVYHQCGIIRDGRRNTRHREGGTMFRRRISAMILGLKHMASLSGVWDHVHNKSTTRAGSASMTVPTHGKYVSKHLPGHFGQIISYLSKTHNSRGDTIACICFDPFHLIWSSRYHLPLERLCESPIISYHNTVVNQKTFSLSTGPERKRARMENGSAADCTLD